MLQTTDVALVPVTSEDLPRLFDWINDRELVLRSAPYRPVTWAQHLAWFDGIVKRDDVHLFGIRHAQTGDLIGTCQLLAVDRTHRRAELQIRIGEPSARGRGFGTLAVKLLVQFGFRDLSLHRIALHVFADNAPAIRAYEKAGFSREGLLRDAAYIDGRYVDLVVMGMLNPNDR